MAINNQSVFGEVAQRSRRFTFMLIDRGRLYGYATIRNGATVTCGGQLTLDIAPEELTREQGSRTTITQTPHGHWTDSFGAAIPRWTLRGTTGWRIRTASDEIGTTDGFVDGYTMYHLFFDMIRAYLDENQSRGVEAFQAGRILRPLIRLIFHDHVDDEWWQIEPDGLPTKRRSSNRPLMYEYDFKFSGASRITERISAIDDPNGQGVIGSDTRDQKIADAYLAAVDTTQTAIDAVEAALRQNPSDAEIVNQYMDHVISRDPVPGWDEHESFDEWQDFDVKRVMETAGEPSEVFNTSVDTLNQPTFLTRAKQVMASSRSIADSVNAWRQKTSSFIAAPIRSVTQSMRGVRDLMNAVAFSMNIFVLGAQVRSALRLLRTELRNLWCAGQSMLSFHYNFLLGLQATMQSFLDLFKLSGCATTFPRVKPLSWQGPQATLPSALGG